MPRTARVAPGGFVYHVLNRSVGRMHMFRKDADFEAFERVMVEAHQRQPIRVLSYCVMSNHWHFVVWPEHDGQLTDFFRRLAHTHAVRWRCRTGPWDTGISIRDASRASRFRVTSICCPWYVMSSETPYLRDWSREPNCGGGGACGQEYTARKRSRPCYRLGQWSGQQTGRLASMPR